MLTALAAAAVRRGITTSREGDSDRETSAPESVHNSAFLFSKRETDSTLNIYIRRSLALASSQSAKIRSTCVRSRLPPHSTRSDGLRQPATGTTGRTHAGRYPVHQGCDGGTILALSFGRSFLSCSLNSIDSDAGTNSRVRSSPSMSGTPASMSRVSCRMSCSAS